MSITVSSRTNQYVFLAEKAGNAYKLLLSQNTVTALDKEYAYHQAVFMHYEAVVFTCYEMTTALHSHSLNFSDISSFKKFIVSIPAVFPQLSMLYDAYQQTNSWLATLIREFENCFTPYRQIDQRFPEVMNDILIPLVQNSHVNESDEILNWTFQVKSTLQYLRDTQQEY